MLRFAIFASASTLALVSASGASAQVGPDQPLEAADDNAGQDDGEIVVTANKRSENLNRVPISVVAATGDQLVTAGVTNTADLVKIVPGFTAQQSFSGAPSFSLRGVGFADVTIGAIPSVSTYIDEASLPFSVMTQGATLDLERVEVLKGPQGILFGQNATGGAINFIARKPTDYFEAGVRASYGRFNTVEGEAYVSGPLSETAAARLAVGGTYSSNWQSRYTADGGSGRQRKLAGRLQIEWKPSSTVRFLLNANGWMDNSNPQMPQFYRYQPGAPAFAFAPLLTYPSAPETNSAADSNLPGSELFPSRDPNYDTFMSRQKLGQITLRGDFGVAEGITLTSLTNYIKMNFDYFTDGDGTTYNIISLGAQSKPSSFGQEVRLSIEPSSGIRFLVGGNYQKDKAAELSQNNYDFLSISNLLGPANVFHTNINKITQSHETWAAFANVDYEIASTLKLSAGLRYTHVKHALADACSADSGDGGIARFYSAFLGAPGLFQPGDCTVLTDSFQPAGETNDTFDESNWSWRGNLAWNVTPTALVYASVSRGYKSGSYINTGVTSADQYLQPVRQERLTSFELGSKIGLFDRRLQLNSTVFYYNYKDKQLVGPYLNQIFGPLTALINVPKSRVWGFEMEATARPVDGLTIRGAVNYTNTKIADDQAPVLLPNVNDVNVDVRGGRFNYAPKWNASGDAEYEWLASPSVKAFVGASTIYNSRTNAFLANGYSNGQLVDPSAEVITGIKSYTTLDLRAGLRDSEGKWEVSAWGRNVTNEWYWTNVQRPIDAVIRYTGRPATYGVSLSYKY